MLTGPNTASPTHSTRREKWVPPVPRPPRRSDRGSQSLQWVILSDRAQSARKSKACPERRSRSDRSRMGTCICSSVRVQTEKQWVPHPSPFFLAKGGKARTSTDPALYQGSASAVPAMHPRIKRALAAEEMLFQTDHPPCLPPGMECVPNHISPPPLKAYNSSRESQ